MNKFQKLHCAQLKAVIPVTKLQDIGTWHGLHSKLVVQSVLNKDHFSVLVPMGNISHTKDRSHVRVIVRNEGNFLKFSVNKLLGRIECKCAFLNLHVAWRLTDLKVLQSPDYSTPKPFSMLRLPISCPILSLAEAVWKKLYAIFDQAPTCRGPPCRLRSWKSLNESKD